MYKNITKELDGFEVVCIAKTNMLKFLIASLVSVQYSCETIQNYMMNILVFHISHIMTVYIKYIETLLFFKVQAK